MLADVVHANPVTWFPSGVAEQRTRQAGHVGYTSRDGETGQPMHLIGCRIVEFGQSALLPPPPCQQSH